MVSIAFKLIHLFFSFLIVKVKKSKVSASAAIEKAMSSLIEYQDRAEKREERRWEQIQKEEEKRFKWEQEQEDRRSRESQQFMLQ